MKEQTLALGSEWVQPQGGFPSPMVLLRGDKIPWLLGELLGQIERLENPRLYQQRMRVCWFANRQGGAGFELAAVASLHFQTLGNKPQLDQSTPHLGVRSGLLGPEKTRLAKQRQPGV